ALIGKRPVAVVDAGARNGSDAAGPNLRGARAGADIGPYRPSDVEIVEQIGHRAPRLGEAVAAAGGAVGNLVDVVPPIAALDLAAQAASVPLAQRHEAGPAEMRIDRAVEPRAGHVRVPLNVKTTAQPDIGAHRQRRARRRRDLSL